MSPYYPKGETMQNFQTTSEKIGALIPKLIAASKKDFAAPVMVITWADMASLLATILVNNAQNIDDVPSQVSIDLMLDVMGDKISSIDTLLRYSEEELTIELFNDKYICAECGDMIIGERIKTPCGLWCHNNEIDSHIDFCIEKPCIEAYEAAEAKNAEVSDSPLSLDDEFPETDVELLMDDEGDGIYVPEPEYPEESSARDEGILEDEEDADAWEE
jgi:hypothetical protein